MNPQVRVDHAGIRRRAHPAGARDVVGEPGLVPIHLRTSHLGEDRLAALPGSLAILAYDPDVVVYGMVLNDPIQAPAFHARQAYLNDWIVDRSRMLEERAPGRLGFLDSRVLAYVRDAVQGYRVGRDTTRWYQEMFAEPNNEGWQETQAYLTRMDRAMRERGGTFLVALWPLMVGLDGGYPFESVHETIGRFCGASGIAECDLLPALRGRQASSLWVHPVDLHPNEVAHRLVAAELLPVLRRLPPRQR